MLVSALLPLVLASAVLASPMVVRQNTRQYNVHNKCPTAIDLYIGDQKDSTIPTDGSVVKNLGTSAGFFYTDANGGNASGMGSIRAGFYDDFYYMVSDLNHANTGIQVKPSLAQVRNGFCETIQCDGRGCSQAFKQPPTRFPPPTSTPPSYPYYRCPLTNISYDITFCPTGQFADQSQPIHFNDLNKCLDVEGAVFANGTPVQIYDCNGTRAQRWLINRGNTKIQLAGTNFCLDAGTNPANGIHLKIWQCYDNLPAQQWYYTDDNRIALQNQGLCADLTNGITTNSNKVQTWTCTDNNANQIWTL